MHNQPKKTKFSVKNDFSSTTFISNVPNGGFFIRIFYQTNTVNLLKWSNSNETKHANVQSV